MTSIKMQDSEVATKLYRQHQASAMFPPMTDEEFDSLVYSIKVNGQRRPIEVRGDEVVDGWHRYRACVELGIEPLTKDVSDDEDAVQLSISENMIRRNMSISKRAMVIVTMSESKDAAVEEQARLMSVSRTSIVKARALLKTGDTEKIEAVLSGKATLPSSNKPKKEAAPAAEPAVTDTVQPVPTATPKPAEKPVVAPPEPEVEDYIKITMEEYDQFLAYREFLDEHDLESAFERQRALIKNLGRERDELLENQGELIRVNAVQRKLLAKANNVGPAVDPEVGF